MAPVIPEIGHFALILAFVFALYQVGFAAIAARKNNAFTAARVTACVYGQGAFLALSYLCLTYAFLTHDFSLAYVAQHSHSLLPWPYQISAVWGAHEGSVLLWATLLAGWSTAFTFFTRKSIPREIQGLVLLVLGLLAAGFLSFLIFTSNPFWRLLPEIPIEGLGLNPLLQDPGLASHPPMLYLGYVGFAITFAVAVAALIKGNFDARWVGWLRPWVLLAWSFLTLGITLGSWWAYRVLGWGGWWFWDPVENAALLPWLTGTALLHSLVIVEKRDSFKVWVVLLSILTFCLSLLGTFLVRSGVLISVHAFANDPLRGSFLLKFLMGVVGGALLLFAWRSQRLASQRIFSFFSKEAFLLFNNTILMVLMLSILFGTLYPLFLEALNLGKISVGPPYFNFIFVPLALPLLVAMCVAPYCHWQRTDIKKLKKQLVWPLALSVLLGLSLVSLFAPLPIVKVIGLSLALAVIVFTLRVLSQQGRRRLGMSLAHVGVAICAIGIILSTLLQTQREVSMAPNEVLTLGAYQFKFLGVRGVAGKNYEGVAADFAVQDQHRSLGLLSPEKRRYVSSANAMSQAAITTNGLRDLYIVLGDPLEKDNWGVRVYYKPYVRFIWLGGLLMMMGGLMAFYQRVIGEWLRHASRN